VFQEESKSHKLQLLNASSSYTAGLSRAATFGILMPNKVTQSRGRPCLVPAASNFHLQICFCSFFACPFVYALLFWLTCGVKLSPWSQKRYTWVKKGKVHPCTGTEALYRLYGP